MLKGILHTIVQQDMKNFFWEIGNDYNTDSSSIRSMMWLKCSILKHFEVHLKVSFVFTFSDTIAFGEWNELVGAKLN